MGDSENAHQPSKKRAALKELSRDNPGLDDDDDDYSGLESGTFKTASEEVLACRRIVRVKRRDPSVIAAATVPASNPFAGIRLVPFTAPAPAPALTSTPTTTAVETDKPLIGLNLIPSEVKQETRDNGKSDATKETDGGKNNKSEPVETLGKQEIQDAGRSDTTKETVDGGEKEKSEAVNNGEDAGEENKIEDEIRTKSEDAAGEETEQAKDDNSNTDKGTECVDKDLGGDQTEREETEGDGNEDTYKNGDNGALSSFQQHSSSKNAFTGLASTGFSASSFSFGLVSQEGLTGSGSESLTQQSSFGFGLPKNGNTSLFGTSSSTTIITKSTGTTTAFPSNKEVSVETGEENEKAAFTADSVMFEYLEGRWKERGKGELKVNISMTDNRKVRLVMRSKGNYRLILNASLYPEMKLASMDKKGITFACVNSISEAKNGLSTFAVKFKDPTVVEEFRAVIEEYKESKSAVEKAAAPLKTPENSPEG